VGKKEKHCDPDDADDAQQGDNWDHVAFDPESRLVVSVVPGKRTSENVRLLVNDFKQRTQCRQMNLITTDEYPVYKTEILEAYGETVVPQRTGKPGRPAKPYKVAPAGLHYAVVHKTREKGRVVKVEPRVVFGTLVAILAALALSLVSKAINTTTSAGLCGPCASRQRMEFGSSGHQRWQRGWPIMFGLWPNG
jgi:hypothetical protein